MSEEKETKNVVEETVDKVVETVKETTEKVVETGKEAVETVKDKVEDVVKVVDAPARSKKATWWNRIWSAIVGAILAILSMFGITNEKIAKLEQDKNDLKNLATEIATSIKDGKIEDAKAAADLIIEKFNEKKQEVKEVVENIKNTDKEAIKDAAIQGAKEKLEADDKKATAESK